MVCHHQFLEQILHMLAVAVVEPKLIQDLSVVTHPVLHQVDQAAAGMVDYQQPEMLQVETLIPVAVAAAVEQEPVEHNQPQPAVQVVLVLLLSLIQLDHFRKFIYNLEKLNV
jgi:hypothetical protein